MAIYVMRRANGDWFALEGKGQLRVPLFHSSHDAMMARLRNVGMLLFEPVALDARLLKEVAATGVDDADFCIVDDPFASLNRSSHIAPAQLALLMSNSVEQQTGSGNGNGFRKGGHASSK